MLALLQSLKISLPGLTPLIFVVYCAITLVFIVMENKEPKTTLAWILLFWLFPVVGLLVYLFAGRGHKTFSREHKLLKQLITSESQPNLLGLLQQQDERLTRGGLLSLNQ